MAEVAIITCGVRDRAVPALREAALDAGVATTVIDAAAGLSHFDARPASALPPAVRRARADCDRADGFVFALQAGGGGCPGPVVNLLQLLGGPAYDSNERPAPLHGRPVFLRIVGAEAAGLLAREQLESVIPALGGVVIGASTADPAAPEWTGAREVVEALRGGTPYATTEPPVDLGLGHVHLPPPEPVVAALMGEASGVSLYAPQAGLARLRAAVGRMLGLDGGRDVAITLGASGALSAALGSHLRPGEAVLIPDPGFPNYWQIATARGLRPVPYRLDPERGFQPDLDELAERSAGARAIIWNFPHNPTGALAPSSVVEGLVTLAAEHDLLILSDEVYRELVWVPQRQVSPGEAGGANRTVAVGSCSKTFAMAGHRVGWASAPPPLLEPLVGVHWAEHMSPPTLGQHAAAAAVEAFEEIVAPLRQTLGASRDAALRALDGAGMVDYRPQGAFYVWLDIGAARMGAADYAAALARETGVTVMPGEAFGASGASRIRVSFAAAPETVESGCRRVRDFHLRHRT